MHSLKGVNFSSGLTRCGVPAKAIYKCVCPKVNKKCSKNDMCTTLCASWIMYKSGLMQPPLISFFMMVSKVTWWLMELVCRRLWALYPPNLKFLYYPHVDPVEVAMALNPSRMPHWGRFVTFSMWLQGYLPRLTDRVRVYNTVLRRQPRFIPCIYALYGRWLQATLWRNVANVPRRKRRTSSLPIRTLEHQGRWEGCVDLPARRG